MHIVAGSDALYFCTSLCSTFDKTFSTSFGKALSTILGTSAHLCKLSCRIDYVIPITHIL
jgi:hypothetical protein